MTLPDAKYGEAAAFSPDPVRGPDGFSVCPRANLPGPGPAATDPAERTHGSPRNAGHGGRRRWSRAWLFGPGLPDQSATADDLRRRYGPVLPLLIRKADDPRTSQAFRDQVRYVISMIG